MDLVNDSLRLLKSIYEDDSHSFKYEIYSDYRNELGGDANLAKCLRYLHDYNLITDRCFKLSVDDKYSFYPGSACQITATGIDLILKSDGQENLADKMNVINVNISTDTLANLAMIIESSKLPPEQKETLLSKLKEHGAKELITQAISSGMSNSQNIIYLFENILK